VKKVLPLAVAIAALAILPTLASARPESALAETQAEARTRTEEMTEWREKLTELKAAKAEVKEQLRLQAAEKAQEIALKRINKLISRFAKLKTIVTDSTKLTDAEKAQVNEQIDAEVVKLEDAATDVKNATTVAEIKTTVNVARSQANTSMQAIKKLVLELRGTRLHNITKHLTTILEKLTAKAEALTLTDEQKAEFTALEESVKASITKADAAIDAKDYTAVKTNVNLAKEDLKKMIVKIKEIKEAAKPAETD
jgi:hypothetical protein